jgi:drug/metabolite transporter (DMT)-like permease
LKIGIALALASTSAIFFAISNICFKLGITPLGELTMGKLTSLKFLVDLLTSKWIVAGVLLTLTSGVFYLSAISYEEVAKVVAVLSLSYIVTALLARALLAEPLTTFKLGGFILIVLGIVMVNSGT